MIDQASGCSSEFQSVLRVCWAFWTDSPLIIRARVIASFVMRLEKDSPNPGIGVA